MQGVWSDFLDILMRRGSLSDFFNYLADHEDFLPTVKEVWDTSPLLYYSRTALSGFHKKLNKTRFENLRALNKTRFGNLPSRTKQAFEELCECQNRVLSDPSPENCARDAEASERWNKS